jgi:uncharacterized membrane protein
MDAEPSPVFGPVQLLCLVFEGNQFRGEILPELERLKNQGVARIIDLLIVRKDKTGSVATLTASDLEWEEATQYGAYVGTLIGLGVGGPEGAERGAIAGAARMADGHMFDEDDAFRLTSVVENGSSIAMILLEHRWMLPLLDAVDRANGYELSRDWVTPEDLVHLGLGSGSGSDAASDDAV